MKKILYILIFLFGNVGLTAQNIDVIASIDTNFLLIGEQTQIELKVKYRLDGEIVNVQFPKLTDTISSKFIEIVYTSPIDTIYPDKTDLSIIEQIQKITITSFDSGSYIIPYFEFQINENLYQTGPLHIEVRAMEVDTSKAIFDIKGPIEEPFSILDWAKENWIWIALFLVLLIAGILFFKYLKNKPEKIIEVAKPIIPAHIISLQKLQQLKEDELWQTGKVKTYHSIISEIIREYLEKRYNVNALENTTDEIMQSLRFNSIKPEFLNKLNQVLVLSDLVKFAKEKPLATENEMSLMNAIEFIEETKQIINNTTDNV